MTIYTYKENNRNANIISTMPVNYNINDATNNNNELERDLADAGRTSDIALEWFKNNEEIHEQIYIVDVLEREKAERQRIDEEKARADEEMAKLHAILDAEFEVFWIKYLEKKERKKERLRSLKLETCRRIYN